jgi:hypothetical protein
VLSATPLVVVLVVLVVLVVVGHREGGYPLHPLSQGHAEEEEEQEQWQQE